MKKLIITTALVAISVGCNRTAECSTTTTTSEGGTSSAPAGKVAERHDMALVRFAHATPGAPAVDVWFGDTKVFPNVSYKTVTAYQTLPGERHEFKLRPSGQDSAEPLAVNSEGLGDGKHYTIVALQKDDGSVTLHPMRDDLALPPEGKAKIRVIHAVPNVGDVDVLMAGGRGELFEGVDFDSATGYKEVDPSRGALNVRKDTGGAQLLQIRNVDLQPNRMYTVIVSGEAAGKKAEAVIVEDQLAQPGVS